MHNGAGRAGDDIIVVEKHGGIAVWTLNNPTKLNCLNGAMLSRLFELFEGDAEHDAVIITGTGRYFSSGAALSDISPDVTYPCRPSTFLQGVADMNCKIFDGFIPPKAYFYRCEWPLCRCGDDLSAAVRRQPLRAFSRRFTPPFKQLGITPEGCSTLTFERKMGAEGARRMLENGEKIDAQTAKALGFVDVLVEDDTLLETAIRFAEDWVRRGKGRLSHRENGGVDRLDALNKREGKELAKSILSRRFMETMGVPKAVAMVASPILRLVAKL